MPFAQTAGMKTSRTPLRGGWDTRSRRGRDSHGEHTAGVWQPAGPGTPGARTLAPGESQSAGARSSTLRRSPEHPNPGQPSTKGPGERRSASGPVRPHVGAAGSPEQTRTWPVGAGSSQESRLRGRLGPQVRRRLLTE